MSKMPNIIETRFPPIPGSILDSKHSHTCVHCGHEWMCYDEEWATWTFEKCKITTSAKSNHSGPFCLLCYHIEMAIRYAQNRSLIATLNSLKLINESISRKQ